MNNEFDQAELRLGHSPDSDDVFMWWPLFEKDGQPPRLNTGQFRFLSECADIETLNRRAQTAELEITAISCAQYPHVKDRYAITACGASIGENYGPKIVSRNPLSIDDLKNESVTIAVPGERTSAFGAMSLLLGTGAFKYQVVPFDQIIPRVANGDFLAGLLIHEGQLIYEQAKLFLIQDLGEWWHQQHGLPLPLGLNVIRRDLEDLRTGTLDEVARLLKSSVEYALSHREESIHHALKSPTEISEGMTDEYIDMYVNHWTLDFGPAGLRAVEVFLAELHGADLVPHPGTIDCIGLIAECGSSSEK